jgi:hypothetical protein
MRPDRASLDRDARADLLSDARAARLQARQGPFYPERGITAESLLAYAQRCRKAARAGNCHAKVLAGDY